MVFTIDRPAGNRKCIPAKGILLVCCLLLLVGCAQSVGVRQVDIHKRFEQIDRGALNDDKPSERTKLFLRRYDLEKKWKHNPKGTIVELDRGVRKETNREALFALMELSYIEARRTENQPGAASKFYLSCAVYAYSYLFDPGFGPPASPYHPHSRDACEFYNRSFAAVLMYLRDSGVRAAPDSRHPLVRGGLVVVDRKSELMWQPGEFDSYHVAYEFEVEGLKNHYQSFGLGVPVILVRTPSGAEVGDPEERFMPKISQTYAATAFLRIAPFISEASETVDTFEAELLLFDPVNSDAFTVGERPAVIEADFTIPLAYLVGRSRAPDGISGLLDAASWRDVQGLHMLQPYQKGKIPVVFVHGLMSSPATWLSMFNDLLGDPVLRKNYQFWFFMYPTGNPIMYSASILRESLLGVRRHFDPEGDDPAFDEMVLVGHSMGGVISRQVIIDSGNRFWEVLSDRPFEEAGIDPEDREILERVFFFKALPFVSRVIFISAPHRGSDWADNRIGRWGSSLVTLPVDILRTTGSLFKKVVTAPQRMGKGKEVPFDIDRVPTGVSGLSPSNPMFVVVDGIPVRSDLPYHSIIGNTEAADTPGGSDGIVPYESSHLEGAVSEKIVHSGHSAHTHPLAILEVNRILMEHLRLLGKIDAPETPTASPR